MSRYRIDGFVTVSISTYVEADSEKEAIENCEASLPNLCHKCASNDGDDQWSLSGELDGEPFALTAEIDEQ
jgi:hypothetical protein